MTGANGNQTNETPAGKAGASCEQLGGWTHKLSTLEAQQAQFLMLAHAVRPEWAGMVAALAFGGAAA